MQKKRPRSLCGVAIQGQRSKLARILLNSASYAKGEVRKFPLNCGPTANLEVLLFDLQYCSKGHI
jgi:hypothetical protein